jgi:hypothetical protein
VFVNPFPNGFVQILTAAGIAESLNLLVDLGKVTATSKIYESVYDKVDEWAIIHR